MMPFFNTQKKNLNEANFGGEDKTGKEHQQNSSKHSKMGTEYETWVKQHGGMMCRPIVKNSIR